MAHLTREEIADVVQSITDEEAMAMERAARRIFLLWSMEPSLQLELLGASAPPPATYSAELKLKLYCVTRIYSVLRQIFVSRKRGYEWMSAPNAAFSGSSALDVIRGDRAGGLLRVWTYLESVANG